ncbi:hypothetical protein [Comamonas sp.]|uniref:hypothetical protein n=1 Tax=Comamonas sp. TaxID=34028 RepID=UPI00258B0CFF|nr:hypothetical protein [Comamonas sp.]
MSLKHLFRLIFAISFSLTSIGTMAQSLPLTSENYMQDGANKGGVLLSVRWDRKWKCAGFENAQLRLLGFDLFPSTRPVDDEGADLLLDDAPLLLTKPRFDDYAFLVEPGQYALSKLHIKVARSVRDVGIAKVGRETLLQDGASVGGTFNVDAGEVVYIGHFSIDCFQEPSLWRVYLKDRESFNEYLADQKKKVPELDTSKASFRLFKSSYFGRDFELE